MNKLQEQFIKSLEGEDLSEFSQVELLDYLEEAEGLGVALNHYIMKELYSALNEKGRKSEFIYLFTSKGLFIENFCTMNDLLAYIKVDRSNFTKYRQATEDGFTYKSYEIVKTSTL